MKKTIVVIASVLLSLVSQAQDIRLTSHAGFSTVLMDNTSKSINPIVFLGIEFKDKFGIEYGNSFNIAKDAFDVYNFAYGLKPIHYVGTTVDFYSVYLITRPDESARFNIGIGAADIRDYRLVNNQNPTPEIKKTVIPFMKTGLTTDVSKVVRWTLNANISLQAFSFSTGVAIKL
jgi:hypothetical protein